MVTVALPGVRSTAGEFSPGIIMLSQITSRPRASGNAITALESETEAISRRNLSALFLPIKTWPISKPNLASDRQPCRSAKGNHGSKQNPQRDDLAMFCECDCKKALVRPNDLDS